MLRLVRAVMMALALAVTVSGAARLDAQVLVVAERGLEFGSLTTGVSTVVQPIDPTRRAEFTVVGRGRYTVTFQLPTALVSPAGHTIPLQFTATDGLVRIRQKQTVFDPSGSVQIRINPADQQASVYLGGRATPAQGQVAGRYEATIVMMIVQTGT